MFCLEIYGKDEAIGWKSSFVDGTVPLTKISGQYTDERVPPITPWWIELFRPLTP